MVSWGGGLLAVMGGAGEGAAKAVKRGAISNQKETLDAKKQAALEAREKNIMMLQQKFQSEENAKGRTHTSTENKKQRDFTAGEGLLSREHSTKMAEKTIGANRENLESNQTFTSAENDKKIASSEKIAGIGLDKIDLKNKRAVEQKINELMLDPDAKMELETMFPEIRGKGQAAYRAKLEEILSPREAESITSKNDDLFTAINNLGISEKTEDVKGGPKRNPRDWNYYGEEEPNSEGGGILDDGETTDETPTDLQPTVNPKLPEDVTQWNVKQFPASEQKAPVAVVNGEEIPLTEYELKLFFSAKRGKTVDKISKTAGKASKWAGRNLPSDNDQSNQSASN